MTKIVLTGGHAATVALAVTDELIKKAKWKIFWIGPKSAMEDAKIKTAAEGLLAQKGVIIKTITAGRLKKKGLWLRRVFAIFKLPIGFLESFFHIAKINPDVVLSFGGFAAFPVVFASFILGKKIVIHEQISGAGLANRLSIPFSDKIAVAREESVDYFPKSKVVVTGNPQVKAMFEVKRKTKLPAVPTILVTGGSSGSQILNRVVREVLPRFLESYFVIHQVGEINLEASRTFRDTLSGKQKERYEIFGYVSPYRMAEYFDRADIIVSRAGANTVADMVSTRRPGVLIPIPWSINDEQRVNAQNAKKLGIALVLEQDELSAQSLFEKVGEVKKNWGKMAGSKNFSGYDIDRGSAQRLVEVVSNYV